MTRRSLALLALVFLAGAAVALGAFFVFGHDRASGAWHGYGYGYGGYAMMGGGPGPGTGPGMMGGSYGPGMMGGGQGPGMMGNLGGGSQSSVTPAQLATVRDRVEQQIAAAGYKGFGVGEIMAFSNNDYVLVEDAKGRPAFELLAAADGRWLMPEPQSMMWNTSYGMMRGITIPGCPYGGSAGTTGGASVSPSEAKARADAWLAERYPDRTTADATALPGYYTIDVTANGTKVGMLSVNSATGAVWYHRWHGRFLADRDF
jgi:hypothetical protein